MSGMGALGVSARCLMTRNFPSGAYWTRRRRGLRLPECLGSPGGQTSPDCGAHACDNPSNRLPNLAHHGDFLTGGQRSPRMRRGACPEYEVYRRDVVPRRSDRADREREGTFSRGLIIDRCRSLGDAAGSQATPGCGDVRSAV